MALKNDTDAVRRTVDALSGDLDRSSRRGKQAADELQKRALAATAGPDNGEELPVEDIELQRLQRLDFTVAAAIRLRHAQHANQPEEKSGKKVEDAPVFGLAFGRGIHPAVLRQQVEGLAHIDHRSAQRTEL